MRLNPEDGGAVVELSLEAYVAGAVAGEQAAGALPEPLASAVLQLQATLSRTFGVANRGRHGREGFDLCATTHCQVFRRGPLPAVPRSRVAAAVSASAGRIVTHRGRPIQALFHSSCGGHTSAADDVWGGAREPYFVARPDPFCALDPTAAWTWRVTTRELGRVLNGDPATRVGGRFNGVSVLERDVAGRARLLALEGERAPVVRGEEFRRVVTAAFGPRSLRSLKFTLQRLGDEYLFDGRGFGHGAGLCQAGASSRLRAGASVADVLTYYFPGTAITPVERSGAQ